MPYCKKCGNELSADAKFCPKCGTPVEVAYAAPVAPGSGLRLALWGERFVAWLIDAIILGIILGALSLFTWFSVGNFTWWANWPGWVPFFNFNVGGVIYFVYWMLMDGAYGQSLGKMVMHLRVTRLDGNSINMGQAALESAGKAFFLPLDVLLGWIFYPRRKQRIFSYLAETVVIREARR